METELIDEPDLEFGHGGLHPDLRFGVIEFGPADQGKDRKPSEIKLGLVGTEQSIEDATNWLTTAAKGLEASGSPKRNLFPDFPGFSQASTFNCELVFDRSISMSILAKDIHEAAAHGDYEERIRHLSELFFEAITSTAAKSPSLVLIAMPRELLEEIVKAEACLGAQKSKLKLYFHDLLKAKSLSLGTPLQLARPQTFDVKLTALEKDLSARSGKQDPATRAWNFFSALYYKAGGFPWRIPRAETDYQSCYIGIAFVQSADKQELHASVAQVFNERGHGIAIKGRDAKISETDRQPHMAAPDAQELVTRCIKAFRDEHKTNPARVVVHKTSNFDDAEISGFRETLNSEKISIYDFMTLDRSRIRVFREGYYPPLRGTWVRLENQSHVLYTRGSVAFYEEYPGMYVPLSLLVKLFHSEGQHAGAMEDLLRLSKLNWNNIQMDSTLPITISGARVVGSILRWADGGETIQREYRFFM